MILALAALFLAATPPDWVLGAGAAVAAVAIQASAALVPASRRHATSRTRWIAYALAGLIAAATVGAWLVLVLLGCGALELALRRPGGASADVTGAHAWPLLAIVGATSGGLLALAWVAFKVGALAYGGGFVIIPLMQHDAVDTYHWMTDAQFLNAVALGQVTPGPVVQTVAVVGYAAAGIGGGLLAAAVAFAPSFSFTCSVLNASIVCAPTPTREPFSTAPDPQRSVRSRARRSRSRSRSPRPGNPPLSPPLPSRSSPCAAASS